MSFRVTHELHHRRFGRNLGLGLVLAAFVTIVFGVTIVKLSRSEFSAPQGQATE